jgi:hypothetical protein
MPYRPKTATTIHLRDGILAALRDGPLRAAEIHEALGGRTLLLIGFPGETPCDGCDRCDGGTWHTAPVFRRWDPYAVRPVLASIIRHREVRALGPGPDGWHRYELGEAAPTVDVSELEDLITGEAET